MFMESRMRGDVHVRLYVQDAVMLKMRSKSEVVPAQRDFRG